MRACPLRLTACTLRLWQSHAAQLSPPCCNLLPGHGLPEPESRPGGWVLRRRFESVVEQLRARASDELWVSLGSCGVHDARMAALTEALAQNSTVTALDLSRNNITEDGAKVGNHMAPPFRGSPLAMHAAGLQRVLWAIGHRSSFRAAARQADAGEGRTEAGMKLLMKLLSCMP